MKQPLALVIEDQENLTMLYEDMLRILGYDVRSIKDGLSAINQIEVLDIVPSLIMLDVNLPRLSGRDVLKHILRREQLKDARIVVVTANNLMAEEMRPLLREGDHFFLKPVRMTDLRAIAAAAKPKNETPDYLVDTIETDAVEQITAEADIIETELLPQIREETTTETDDPKTRDAKDEIEEEYVPPADVTIVNRKGMLWLKNALAEAAAKKAAKEETQKENDQDATSPERPQGTHTEK